MCLPWVVIVDKFDCTLLSNIAFTATFNKLKANFVKLVSRMALLSDFSKRGNFVRRSFSVCSLLRAKKRETDLSEKKDNLLFVLFNEWKVVCKRGEWIIEQQKRC